MQQKIFFLKQKFISAFSITAKIYGIILKNENIQDLFFQKKVKPISNHLKMNPDKKGRISTPS